MGVDRHGQLIHPGDEVIVRLKVVDSIGDVLHLHTVVPTEAYPEGTRVNLLSGQVEKLEQEAEVEKEPLNGDGSEKQQPGDNLDPNASANGEGEEGEGKEGEGEGEPEPEANGKAKGKGKRK